MMKLFKSRFLASLSIMMLILSIHFPIYAADTSIPYPSYTYTFSKGYAEAVSSPAPYVVSEVIMLSKIIPQMKIPVDFCKDSQGNWYLLDSETASIYCLDAQWNLIRTISSFERDGTTDRFSTPEGVFVSADGYLYIADTQNSRIVKLSVSGEYQTIIGEPESGLFNISESYLPSKIAVSENGMLYIIAKNDYSGILQLDKDGRFIGYMGSNQVVYDPIEKLWKSLLTKEQKKSMIQFIPVEYTAMSIDKSGFIYTVSNSKTEINPIKRLNPAGKDVLVRQGYDSNVAGDVDTRSILIDICIGENNTYTALDSEKGRMFTYDADGNLLFAFGLSGNQWGTFSVPAGIESDKDNLYVLDKGTLTVSRFAMTEYGSRIHQGLSFYGDGKYDESTIAWQSVLKKNCNFDIAYVQIGKVLLREKKYKEAMEYFKLGNYRGNSVIQEDGYNKAFQEYRNQVFMKNFGYIMGMAIGITLLVFILMKWINIKNVRNKKKEIIL